MKSIVFAAMLMIGGTAIAQTAEPQPSGETVSDPSQSTGPRGETQQGTDPNGMATAPDGTNMAPADTMAPAVPAPDQGAAFAPRAAAQDYPPCSKTVTDGCVQTYEKGVRRPRG